MSDKRTPKDVCGEANRFAVYLVCVELRLLENEDLIDTLNVIF